MAEYRHFMGKAPLARQGPVVVIHLQPVRRRSSPRPSGVRWHGPLQNFYGYL